MEILMIQIPIGYVMIGLGIFLSGLFIGIKLVLTIKK